MRNRLVFWFLLAGVLSWLGCRKKELIREEIPVVKFPREKIPDFNADSAYFFINRQVQFGPRIPNTPAHAGCAKFLENKLKDYGAEIIVQEFSTEAYNGVVLNLKNVIGSFAPEKQKRLLLAAHWDTRPFADKDTINNRIPFDGANDGGSGVGVLLEVARILSGPEKPEIGVDVIFFDGEDYGEPDFEEPNSSLGTSGKIWWCLGSQYWAKNRHKKNYSAYYGILLDMVGAEGANFYQEGGSVQYAAKIVNKFWKEASHSGYSHYFVNRVSPGITDDHIFINRDAKIPAIAIVEFDPGNEESYFPYYHHTRYDNMSIISKETLKAVGQTLVNVIYLE